MEKIVVVLNSEEILVFKISKKYIFYFIIQGSISSSRRIENIYLGLSDAITEGTFLWTVTGSVASYTNWYPGEPNDNEKREDCVLLSYNGGKWGDFPCDTNYDKMNTMCEKVVKPIGNSFNHHLKNAFRSFRKQPNQ